MTVTKKIINLVAAPLIVVLAVVIAGKLISSKKTLPVVSPQIAAARVNVIHSSPTTVRPELKTFGTTQTYLSTAIASQVSGEILRISPDFESGKGVSKGDWLVEIDPADYQTTLASRKSSLATAQQSFAEEETLSRLASEDWVASGRSIADANDFTLRKPQLAAAQAAIEAAQASVDQAVLNLNRTTIRAPFDAIIETRDASPGNIVGTSTNLGKLFARERIQVRLPITPLQAIRIILPRFGTDSPTLSATLSTPTVIDATWTAQINRAEPTVDPKNQTIYLVGEIENPFDNVNAFLPVGAFVNATILGQPLENVHLLPEVAVVDDAFVWVVSPDNQLAKQAVEIAFSQDGEILARIADPIFPLPLLITSRPLTSFKVDQPVTPID